MIVNSGIYSGRLKHSRLAPKKHEFDYRVFMLLVDLDELDEVIQSSRLFGSALWSPVQFKRSDYFGDSEVSLVESVRNKVECETGQRPNGKILMLANWRYFGYVTNPIVVYYCYNNYDQLQSLVLEVTNTPWHETHVYVLPCDPDAKMQRIQFAKAMHVSPFNPMQIEYRWISNDPTEQLTLHLENWRNESKEFYASLRLQRRELTRLSLMKATLAYPFMTIKVIAMIYWNALRLWLKGVPLYRHPRDTVSKSST